MRTCAPVTTEGEAAAPGGAGSTVDPVTIGAEGAATLLPPAPI